MARSSCLTRCSTQRWERAAGRGAGDRAANEDSDGKVGSYTNTHESGKKYHGKGSEERAKQSGKEKAEENTDPVKETEWTSSTNMREAFKDEAKRIRNDGGVQNSNNYNKINSPRKISQSRWSLISESSSDSSYKVGQQLYCNILRENEI